MQVLELALTWLRYDWENRGSCALNFLQSIRLGLVPEENLKSLLEDPEMLEIPGCSDMIKKVVELQNDDECLWSELSQTHPHWFATRSTITVSFYHRDIRGIFRRSQTRGPSESLILAPWSKAEETPPLTPRQFGAPKVFFPEAPA